MTFEPIKMTNDMRGAVIAAQKAIKNIEDIFVECITNVDDSEERISIRGNKKKWHGKLRIEYFQGGKNQKEGKIIFKDKAEGMSYDKLIKVSSTVSEYQSGNSGRGLQGRGLKDISVIGPVNIKTLKNQKFSEVKVDIKNALVTPIIKDENPSNGILKTMGLKKNESGTTVTISLPINAKNYHPGFNDLANRIPDHYALSNILRENDKSLDVTMVNLANNEQKKLTYIPPKVEKVYEGTWDDKNDDKIKFFNKKFKTNHKVHFVLYKSNVPLQLNTKHKMFQQCGITIEGNKAVHEKGFFNKQVSNDRDAQKFYGRLRSGLIDRSLDDFKSDLNPTEYNPNQIIDPNRQTGIDYDHPLAKALIKKPKKIFEQFLKKESEKTEKQDWNKETLKSLKDLAKFANKYLEEIDTEFTEDDINKINELPINKWYILPQKKNLYVDEIYNFSVYTRTQSLIENESAFIEINHEYKDFVEFIKSKSNLKKTKFRNNDVVKFSFKIKAKKPSPLINLRIKQKNITKTETEIIVKEYEDRKFLENIEFEHKNYSVKKNGKRECTVYARSPEIVKDYLETDLICENQTAIKVPKKIKFEKFFETNYAKAKFNVFGLKENDFSRLTIKIGEFVGYTKVDVKNEKDDDESSGYEIKLLYNKDSGDQRYKWAGEGTQLTVFTSHPAVEKFLGKNKEHQNSIEFKIILGDVVTDALLERKITGEIQVYGDSRFEEFDDVMGSFVNEKDSLVTKVRQLLINMNELNQ